MRVTRTLFTAALAGLLFAPAPARAQNREHQQMFLDVRLLQEQVQQLRLAVAALTELLGTVNGRVEAQGQQALTGFANQKVTIDGLVGTVAALREKVDESSVRVSKLTQDVDALRQGVTLLTDLVTQALSQLGGPPDPNAPVPAGGLTPPPLPASPTWYYDQAWGYYAAAQYDLAIEAFQDLITRFPESPDAPRAQYYIGESYYWTRRYKEAAEAFGVVITRYKGSDSEPEAYHKQGLCYEELGQAALARKNYEYIRQQFAETGSPRWEKDAMLATQALKRMGIIKD